MSAREGKAYLLKKETYFSPWQRSSLRKCFTDLFLSQDNRSKNHSIFRVTIGVPESPLKPFARSGIEESQKSHGRKRKDLGTPQQGPQVFKN